MVHLANFIDSVSIHTLTHTHKNNEKCLHHKPKLKPMFSLANSMCVCVHTHVHVCVQIYIQLNVRVVLVGLEIWTQQNPISTDGGAGEVLSRFTQWREKELVPRRRHDSAQLILSVYTHALKIHTLCMMIRQ